MQQLVNAIVKRRIGFFYAHQVFVKPKTIIKFAANIGGLKLEVGSWKLEVGN